MGGYKLAGIVGIISIAAMAILFGLWRTAVGRVDIQKAITSQRDTEISGLKGQNAELIASNKGLAAAAIFAADAGKIGATADADLTGRTGEIQSRHERERNDVADQNDGPAAAVLCRAAYILRETTRRIETLRAGDAGKADLPGMPPAGVGPADPAAAGCPRSQRAFAILATDWAAYAERLVEQPRAIKAWETDYNARVAAENARAVASPFKPD